jgi:hypothetical protein
MIRATPCMLILAVVLMSAPAEAQIIPPVPDLQSRIPAPLPPPPEPPIINGPYQQAPPPGVIIPPRISTFGNRITRCVHDGASAGLRGGRLDRYTRACANDY